MGPMEDFMTEYDAKTPYNGMNIFDRVTSKLSVVSLGPTPVVVSQTPSVVLSMGLIINDVQDVFNDEDVLYNIAAILGIPPSKIRIVKVS